MAAPMRRPVALLCAALAFAFAAPPAAAQSPSATPEPTLMRLRLLQQTPWNSLKATTLDVRFRATNLSDGSLADLTIGVTMFGLVVAASGLVLDFPNYGQTRATMQTFNLIHAVTAIVLMLLSFGHIYMGTVGVDGALDSMKTGVVDETWAKEHHEYWYNDVMSGKAPRGSAPPAMQPQHRPA